MHSHDLIVKDQQALSARGMWNARQEVAVLGDHNSVKEMDLI